MECKVLIAAMESERHPDIAVYLDPPRNRKGRAMWRTWFPDLIIEVVSESSRIAITPRNGTNTGNSASRNTGSWMRSWSRC